jgi:hypothetical protein
MNILDLSPPCVTIKFTKGSTLNPIFYCTTDDRQAIDLTGFHARMMAKLTATSPSIVEFDLTTENGGLVIEQGTAVIGIDSVLTYGVRLNVSATVTTAITWDKALFSMELIAPSGKVTTFVNGTLRAMQEIVK